MNNMEVSVIVPVYNVEKYLARCLDSLVGQDFTKPYEIIVVDDGSTDKSVEIARDYARRFENIIICTQKNSGVSSARNVGISRARGRYIAFADSDDFVEENYISTLYNLLEQSGAWISYCNFFTVNETGSRQRASMLSHKSGIFTSAQMLKPLLRDISLRCFPCNKMFRRELFTERNIKFPEGRVFEDMCVMPRIFLCSEKIAVTKNPLYNYRMRKGSIVHQMSLRGIGDYVNAYGEVRSFLNENNIFRQNKHAFDFLGVKITITVIVWLLMAHSRDKSFGLMSEIRSSLRRIRGFAK